LLTTVAPAHRFDHVWLCGPHAMLDDARAVLSELGVPADRVHFELFYVDAPPPDLVRAEQVPTGETAELTVVLDGSATTLSAPLERSVLDSAQTIRADLPFACKGGVCGTCRAKVTAGEVDMRRNYALEPAEVEAGFVLTCQSFPVGDAATVDFDA
jgi:ring-1,2-phenylacetyl-CoA epoxidase subunit PaaE